MLKASGVAMSEANYHHIWLKQWLINGLHYFFNTTLQMYETLNIMSYEILLPMPLLW